MNYIQIMKLGQQMNEQEFIIVDWAGNDVFRGQTFETFEDANDFLCEFLDESYEDLRDEYEIVPK